MKNSSAAQARLDAAGFKLITQRETCARCRHSTTAHHGVNNIPTVYCAHIRAAVSRFGICPDFKP
jgi:hypothetical protein